MHLVAVFFGLLYVHTCNRKEFFEYKSGEIHYNLITKDFIFGLAISNMGYLPGLYASSALSLTDISKVNLVQNIAKLPSFLSSAFGQTLLIGTLASEHFQKKFYVKLYLLTAIFSLLLFILYIYYIEDKFFLAYKQSTLIVCIIFLYSLIQMVADVYVTKSKGVAANSTRKSWMVIYYFSFIVLMIFIDAANIDKYAALVLACEIIRIVLILNNEKKYT
jgi:hypothetical protein